MSNIHNLIPIAALSLLSLANCTGEPQTEGKRLYVHYCANCHLEDGRGVGALVPPLAGADYLHNNRDALPCILVHGLADTIYVNGQLYAEQMPGVESLSHIEVTNILNYIGNAWGNESALFIPDQVKEQLKTCDH
ncbi:MAG: cytochrome c [Saprospiraceae bacterium]|nr:cytochrome c [Saprospiraceae bacterium]